VNKSLNIGYDGLTNYGSVNVHRTITGSFPSGFHGFEDISSINMTGSYNAYAAFAAGCIVTGSSNYDHIVGFQSGVGISGSGNISRVDAFATATDVAGSGTVTDLTGVHVYNPLSSGVISNNYGMRIESMTRGRVNNYGLWIDAPGSGSGNSYSLYCLGNSTFGGTMGTNDFSAITGHIGTAVIDAIASLHIDAGTVGTTPLIVKSKLGGYASIRFSCDGSNWSAFVNYLGYTYIGSTVDNITVANPVIVTPTGDIMLTGFLQLPPIARPSPANGVVYNDSSDHHLYFYNGSLWKQLDN
jgi:hypothetical protein